MSPGGGRGLRFGDRQAFRREDHMGPETSLGPYLLSQPGPLLNGRPPRAEGSAGRGTASLAGRGRVESTRLCRAVAAVCAECGVDAFEGEALRCLEEAVGNKIIKAASLMKEKLETGQPGANTVQTLMECMKAAGFTASPRRLAAVLEPTSLEPVAVDIDREAVALASVMVPPPLPIVTGPTTVTGMDGTEIFKPNGTSDLF